MSNSQRQEAEQNAKEHSMHNEEEQEDFFNEEEQEEEQEATFVVSTNSNEFNTNDAIYANLSREINLCQAFFIGFEFRQSPNAGIVFKIPISILPLSVSVVNGFYDNSYLLECEFSLSLTDLFRCCPFYYSITNPTYGTKFPGSILIQNRVHNFFSKDYVPPTHFRCQNYVLAPQSTADSAKIESRISALTSEGFPYKSASKALQFCSYDINNARDYLLSGLLPQESFPLPVRYIDSPLFFLVLEICEAFFDMGDSCCVCGKNLGVYHLKPACCNDQLCQHSFLNLGVGSNIIREIKRDPLATDFIISLAGAAFIAPPQPPVFEPSPLEQNLKFDKDFFLKLPSMKKIANKCNTDIELATLIGANNFEILRFFILANKAQLITLEKDLCVNIGVSGKQFLITSVSPESELIFREKRKKYGVKWFWHGSRAERWYRILHTGLKDFGNTSYQLHAGPIYGDGIYMSDSFNYSYNYCVCAHNIYKNSALPKELLVISLVENASVPELNGPVTANEYTQRDEKALITRVLFLIDTDNPRNSLYDYNTLTKPPKVPTLNEVLSKQLKKFI